MKHHRRITDGPTLGQSLVFLLSALVFAVALLGWLDAEAQGYGYGGYSSGSESGVWSVGPQTGVYRHVVRPSGRIDTIVDRGAANDYGTGFDQYLNNLTNQYQSGYNFGQMFSQPNR